MFALHGTAALVVRRPRLPAAATGAATTAARTPIGLGAAQHQRPFRGRRGAALTAAPMASASASCVASSSLSPSPLIGAAVFCRTRRRRASSSAVTPCRAALVGDVLNSPKGRVESESLPKSLRDGVMDAVESLGGSVTVGDVAAAAGVKVSEAERAMTAIAADTGAALEVSSAGDLLYVYPPGFRGALGSKSLRIRAEPFLEGASKAGAYLLRVSFGTTLIASIAIVYAAIFALLSNRDDRDDRRSDNRGMGGGMMGFGPRMYFSPFDVFWYFDPYYYERRAYNVAMEGARDMNFFEAVFSFVFGDGDPNREFEQRRWALVGLAIQKNKGVVTAEQLAPFLERDEDARGTDDESFVLPALTRFGGAPEVDACSGEIVYRFEALESTAGGFAAVQDVLAAAPRGFSTAMAEEEPYEFSLATQAQRTMAAALGVFNFVGVVVLGRLCVDPAIVANKANLVASITTLLPGLQLYAVAFFAIPAARWVIVSRRNAAIEARNSSRLEASRDVARPGKLLKDKLDAAKRAATGRRVVTSEDAVFSSAKSVADFEADEFERRLNERN